jgi:molybdate transport system regulatory protein
MAKPAIRFRIDFNAAHSVGPGKIELLEHIRATGSLSQAGREIGMSYRRAWLLLDSLNSGFREPVVATSIGGKAGGGAQLTELGAALVSAYRSLEADFNALAVKNSAAKKLAAAVKTVKSSGAGAALRTPLVRSAAPRRVKKSAGGRASTRL